MTGQVGLRRKEHIAVHHAIQAEMMYLGVCSQGRDASRLEWNTVAAFADVATEITKI